VLYNCILYPYHHLVHSKTWVQASCLDLYVLDECNPLPLVGDALHGAKDDAELFHCSTYVLFISFLVCPELLSLQSVILARLISSNTIHPQWPIFTYTHKQQEHFTSGLTQSTTNCSRNSSFRAQISEVISPVSMFISRNMPAGICMVRDQKNKPWNNGVGTTYLRTLS
jgi:hypothetical protein